MVSPGPPEVYDDLLVFGSVENSTRCWTFFLYQVSLLPAMRPTTVASLTNFTRVLKEGWTGAAVCKPFGCNSLCPLGGGRIQALWIA